MGKVIKAAKRWISQKFCFQPEDARNGLSVGHSHRRRNIRPESAMKLFLVWQSIVSQLVKCGNQKYMEEDILMCPFKRGKVPLRAKVIGKVYVISALKLSRSSRNKTQFYWTNLLF